MCGWVIDNATTVIDLRDFADKTLAAAAHFQSVGPPNIYAQYGQN